MFCRTSYLFETSAMVGILLLVVSVPSLGQAPREQAPDRPAKRPRARQLGSGFELRRDPATGELIEIPRAPETASRRKEPSQAAVIRSRVSLVEVNCNVFAPDGRPWRALKREDFKLFENDIEQAIVHFDRSTEPASIAVIFDASPSVFRELEGMKRATRQLALHLAPADEVAVVAFAAEAQLLVPFSRDRALLEGALGSSALARVADSSRSNIYQAIFLTARELFRARPGRKAIVVLTDGQDSSLGLSWDPASAAAPVGAGEHANRLSFEDVARELAADGVELHAVSTQTRPPAMTEEWLLAHKTEMLVTPASRELGMIHYTLYLAELVRRVGGRLYFLREVGTLEEVYRRIAETLAAQYTLGYYPSAGLAKPGWRALRVALRTDGVSDRASGERSEGFAENDPARATIQHRVAYYVPASGR